MVKVGMDESKDSHRKLDYRNAEWIFGLQDWCGIGKISETISQLYPSFTGLGHYDARLSAACIFAMAAGFKASNPRGKVLACSVCSKG